MYETVKLKYTSWWGTKGCSRSGIINGNHRGTGLMDAVAATHSVVVVAVLVALLRPPTIKIKPLILLRRLNKKHSRTRWAHLVEGAVPLVSACNCGGTKHRGILFD